MTIETFRLLLYIWIAAGAATFILLLNITAPYGRHSTSKWGPQINNSYGWVLMEFPVMALLMYYVITNAGNQNAVTYTLVAAFMIHYIHRTFIFPMRIRTKGKKMPVVIVVSGIIFNLANGFFLGYYFGRFAQYDIHYFTSVSFMAGISLFIIGMFINMKSDNMLIQLRKPDETGYRLPTGWLFKYISCPNLFGEIIEWGGFAIMCWNLPALSFFVWTVANLLPRALAHHQWYKKSFSDYPAGRKAVIPFWL